MLCCCLLLDPQPGHAGLLDRWDLPVEQPVSTSEENLQRRLKRRGQALWKIPLGTAFVEDLRWVGDGRIYVSLRDEDAKLGNLDHMVINASDGSVLWRSKRPRAADRFSVLHAAEDILLINIDAANGQRVLTGLSIRTGEEVWSRKYKPHRKHGHIAATVVAAENLVIAVDPRKRSASAIRLSDGTDIWRRNYSKSDESPRSFLSDGFRVWDPNGTFTAVNPQDGQSLWDQTTAVSIDSGAPPQSSADHVVARSSKHDVLLLDAHSGEIVWQTRLPGSVEITNLYPYGNRIYVRGRSDAGEDTESNYLFALNHSDGRIDWQHETADPSLSNIVEHGGFVYHASGADVFKVNQATGQQILKRRVTDTGRTYPVRLRAAEKHLVYIGELVIAGLRYDDGAILFKHGVTPISADTSLNALDVSIPRLQKQLGANTSGPGLQLGEAQRYQNMANAYHRQAQNYRSSAFMSASSGNKSSADNARFRAIEAQAASRAASAHARTMAGVEMAMSVMNLAMEMQKAWKRAGIQAIADRQILFRNSILSNYAAAENIDYVYRPQNRFKSSDNNFVGVQVVNLESGARRFNYLSPTYRSYGLWNLIDFERSVVIHHGIGLDSTDYHYSEERRPAILAPKIKTIENFLIAAPIRLPK